MKIALSIAGQNLHNWTTADVGIVSGNAFWPHDVTFAHKEPVATDRPKKPHERAAPWRTGER